MLLLTLVFACRAPLTNPGVGEPELLFASGFEGDIQLEEKVWEYENIVGTDSETGFTWPISVLGSNEAGLHSIDDADSSLIFSELQTVVGRDGLPTRALYSEEVEHHRVTQCPYEILNITEGSSDLYIRYWMKVDAESLSLPDTWRALFEWKSKGYGRRNGFRLIAYIYTDDQGSPYWHFQGDHNPQNPVWEIDNYDIPVPGEEWFLTEYYWHWSEGEDGHVWWKVNGQLVGEHRGPTTRRHQPIDFIMLTQLYGDGNPKHQWVDDIEIWNTVPSRYEESSF